MIVGSILATTLFFPLNYFLMFDGNLGGVEDNLQSENILFESQVKGVQTQKDDNVFLESVLPMATYQPVRNEDTYDIAVPEAHASLILDADSGAILHEKNANEKRQIASLTKIMTAILAVESIDNLDEEVITISEQVLRTPGTTIGCPNTGYCISQRLVVGEEISAKNLFKAMLMNSANDAATALAIHIGGTQEDFVNMMNAKARSLGLKNTNFCTPSGLETPGREGECYSTAYDIGKIASYALKYDVIWDTFNISDATISSIDGKYEHQIGNTNRLLSKMPNMIGAKTGFTPMAGYSLFMAAHDESGKHRIISVVLDDPYRWEDAQDMVEWACNSFTWY